MSETAIPFAYSSDTTRHYTIEQVNLMRIDQHSLLCSNCQQPVCCVRPDDKVHHFRHETCLKSLSEVTNDTDIDFDNNVNNSHSGRETSWHRLWTKEIVGARFSEIELRVGNKRSRADIYIPETGLRFEAQHSSIDRDTIELRNSFRNQNCRYSVRDDDGNVLHYFAQTTPTRNVWLFDATERDFELQYVTLTDGSTPYYRFKRRYDDDFTGVLDRNVYVDVGYDKILQIDMHAKIELFDVYKADLVEIGDFLTQTFGDALVHNAKQKFASRPKIFTIIENVNEGESLQELKDAERQYNQSNQASREQPKRAKRAAAVLANDLIDDELADRQKRAKSPIVIQSSNFETPKATNTSTAEVQMQQQWQYSRPDTPQYRAPVPPVKKAEESKRQQRIKERNRERARAAREQKKNDEEERRNRDQPKIDSIFQRK